MDRTWFLVCSQGYSEARHELVMWIYRRQRCEYKLDRLQFAFLMEKLAVSRWLVEEAASRG